MADREFLRTEYSEKWEYVRAIETLDYKYLQSYLLINGGVIAFAFRDHTRSIEQALQEPSSRVLFLFLVFYSLFMIAFLSSRKRNYDRYTARLLEIEESESGFVLSSDGVWRPKVSTIRVSLLGLVATGDCVALAYSFGLTTAALILIASGTLSICVLMHRFICR